MRENKSIAGGVVDEAERRKDEVPIFPDLRINLSRTEEEYVWRYGARL